MLTESTRVSGVAADMSGRVRDQSNPVDEILSLLTEQKEATFGITQQLEALATASAKIYKH